MKTSSESDGSKATLQAGRLVLALLVVAVLLPAAAWALSLGELRSQGIVGERFDGYAVVRQSPAPAGVQEFVDRINAQRQSIYEERAAQQGVPAGQVGRIYARQIFAEMPSGTWFLDESGRWIRN